MAIRVENLVKNYGDVKVVKGISFEVEKGEFVSLLGPSGCGKTTTLRCIAGLELANGGEITIGNEVVSKPEAGIMLPPHLRHIGMVFQSYAIWPHMTVYGNVAFPLEVQKIPRAEIDRRVDLALEMVGLRELRDRRAPQLSGGQQQRVALARAVVQEPRVLLFDEPLSNLDAKLRDHTRAEIRRLQRELNVAAIYVTHDQAEALSLSDRVIVMNQGEIVEVGEPRRLYRRPAHPFVADFVGAANFLDVTIEAASDGALIAVGPGQARLRLPDVPGQVGGKYKLMVRPERLSLAPAGQAEFGPDWNVVKGQVVHSQFVGAYVEYMVQVGETAWRVFSPVEVEGEDVAIGFKLEDCSLLPYTA
jgi:ABC-type Fe3+/spermidine/putrescine transport system ATPase subunit